MVARFVLASFGRVWCGVGVRLCCLTWHKCVVCGTVRLCVFGEGEGVGRAIVCGIPLCG